MPILGCCKGIESVFDPPSSPDYVWDANVLSSILKPDGSAVITDGDDVNSWIPVLGSITENTTFTKFGASGVYPKFFSYNNKRSINVYNNMILVMNNTIIKAVNTTLFFVVRWASTNVITECSISYTVGTNDRGTTKIQQLNNTSSVIIVGSTKKISTPLIVSNGSLVIYAFSYNSATNEYRTLLDYTNNIYTVISPKTLI
jgi:hypothetical protein